VREEGAIWRIWGGEYKGGRYLGEKKGAKKGEPFPRRKKEKQITKLFQSSYQKR